MELESSVPHLQVPAASPYSEPARSSPYSPPQPRFLKIIHLLPNFFSLFHCLGCTKGSVQARGIYIHFRNKASFYGEELLAPRPTFKLEGNPLSAVRDLFNILPATLHIGGRSSKCNLRTCHALVIGTHLSWAPLLPYRDNPGLSC